jgi:hypothetical protein
MGRAKLRARLPSAPSLKIKLLAWTALATRNPDGVKFHLQLKINYQWLIFNPISGCSLDFMFAA